MFTGPDHSSARPERWLAAAADDPDSLPGRSPRDREHCAKTFAALRERSGVDEHFISLDRLRERVEALESEAETEECGFEVDDANPVQDVVPCVIANFCPLEVAWDRGTDRTQQFRHKNV